LGGATRKNCNLGVEKRRGGGSKANSPKEKGKASLADAGPNPPSTRISVIFQLARERRLRRARRGGARSNAASE